MKILAPIMLLFLILPFSGFDFTKHSIPPEKIRSGGPPKDGIPSLNEPLFVTAPKADFLSDSDLVLGVVVGGSAKAYPIKILNWHEAVNDRIENLPVLATW